MPQVTKQWSGGELSDAPSLRALTGVENQGKTPGYEGGWKLGAPLPSIAVWPAGERCGPVLTSHWSSLTTPSGRPHWATLGPHLMLVTLLPWPGGLSSFRGSGGVSTRHQFSGTGQGWGWGTMGVGGRVWAAAAPPVLRRAGSVTKTRGAGGLTLISRDLQDVTWPHGGCGVLAYETFCSLLKDSLKFSNFTIMKNF